MSVVPPLNICLIMHSTRSDNMGVGALTVSEVDILRRLGAKMNRELRITVVDFKDDRTPYISGDDIRIVDLDRKFMISRRGFWAEVRAADLVIDIGGGDSFADIYGPQRLRKMLLLKMLTHLAGTPLVLAPQTIGPFTRGWARRLALASLRRCALVATRDTLSTKALRDMGYRGDIVEASDVALRLPCTRPAPRAGNARPQVGLNVSGLLMAGGYTGRNELGLTADYPALIRRIIKHFMTLKCDVHLVSHVIVRAGRMQQEDDYRASEALAQEFPGTILAPAFDSPQEAKSYIAGMDFFVGARMHACIAAFSTGVPVIPMAYSRKFTGLFGTLGFHRTAECTRQGNDEIFAAIADGYEARDTIAAEIRGALDTGLSRLDAYEDALCRIMAPRERQS